MYYRDKLKRVGGETVVASMREREASAPLLVPTINSARDSSHVSPQPSPGPSSLRFGSSLEHCLLSTPVDHRLSDGGGGRSWDPSEFTSPTQHASEGRRSTHMSNNGLMPTSHTASATLNVTVDAERGAGEELGGDDGDSEQPLGAAGEVLFGVISATVIIPVCISFSTIIFSDPFFAPYAGELAKLCLFSSAVHCLCFLCFSQMPFAVGQVQDAGLVFMSAMASSVVKSMDKGQPPEEVLATTLCVLGLFTACLGVSLVLTGRFKLGTLVAYLPIPVIGGYLAFIGLFCGQAGLGLMAHTAVRTPLDLFKLDAEQWMLIAPGVVMGVVLYAVATRTRHVLVLPATMAFIVASFYVVLLATGTSLDEARHNKWLPEPGPSVEVWRLWGLYAPAKAHWSKALSVIPTFLGMYLVVAFGSSLDVAAIQMDLGRPLDVNRELQVVGLSNAISGCLGGYSGSYIFSQTIFLMRARVRRRLATLVIFVIQLTVVAMPLSPLPYVPNAFFGAILIFIMIDLAADWLYKAYWKLSLQEYFNLWASFVLIVRFGLETGMLLGCIVCALGFMLAYARSNTHEFVEGRARVIRSRFHAIVLRHALQSNALTCLQLNGYIFFGSSLQIAKRVDRAISRFAEQRRHLQHNHHTHLQPELYTRWRQHILLDLSRVVGLDATAARAFAELRHVLVERNAVLGYAGMRPAVHTLLEAQGAYACAHVRTFETMDDALQWSEDEHLEGYEESRTFSMTRRGAVPSISAILRYCLSSEQCTLNDLVGTNELGSTKRGRRRTWIASSPGTSLDGRGEPEPPSADEQLLSALVEAEHVMDEYFVRQTLPKGTTLFKSGDHADAVWFVACGQVTLQSTEAEQPGSSHEMGAAVSSMFAPHLRRVGSSLTALNNQRQGVTDFNWRGSFSQSSCSRSAGGDQSAEGGAPEGQPSKRHVMLQFGVGAAVGDMDFMLQQRRSFSAQITSDTGTVYKLTRRAFDKMMTQRPLLATLVQSGLLKSSYLATAQYLEAYT